MKKVYATYRMAKSIRNHRNPPSFYVKDEFADYFALGLLAVHDMDIDDENYTGELAGGVKDLNRFMIIEYNDQAISKAQFDMTVANIGARFNVVLFDSPEEARVWLNTKTNLKKKNTTTYITKKAYEDIDGLVPEKTITVD